MFFVSFEATNPSASLHHYYIYITTNPGKTVLYIGVTNDLRRRLKEHLEDNMDKRETFAGKYFFYNLVYFEFFQNINQAIARETEIKKWSRAKKEAMNFLLT